MLLDVGPGDGLRPRSIIYGANKLLLLTHFGFIWILSQPGELRLDLMVLVQSVQKADADFGQLLGLARQVFVLILELVADVSHLLALLFPDGGD